MTLKLFDSHCHAQFAAYDADRASVIGRALEAGVGMVNVGTNLETSRDAVALAARYPAGLWATVGFHPQHIAGSTYRDPQELSEAGGSAFHPEELLALARDPKVVAIGECGLDFAHFARARSARLQNGASAEAAGESGLPPAGPEEIKKRQEAAFVQHIEVAAQSQKPLVLHCRSAFPELIAILRGHATLLRQPAGVVHFFSGSWDDAQRLLDFGFYLGFGGVITFARDYDEVVRKVPLERILLETDAPYVAPLPYRGQRNEPAYIVKTARKIAELRGISYDEVAAATTANARRLFGI